MPTLPYSHYPTILAVKTSFWSFIVWLTIGCSRCYGSSNLPRKRRGPAENEFSDSETLDHFACRQTLSGARGNAPGCGRVRASYRHLFPRLPEDSRFSRRAQGVREALRGFRQALLSWADADREPVRLLDSFPMPLCECYRISQSSQPISGSGFAFNSSKKIFYFGLHPGLIMTESGFIEDIILAPACYSDVAWLEAYRDECLKAGKDIAGQEWVMDKGFVSQPLKDRAKELLNVTLLARQRDYKNKPANFWQRLLDRLRKPIEGVISVLTEGFDVEHPLVRSDIGLYRRTQAKATAFSLARYFNEVLDVATKMNIARYAV